MPDLFEYIDDKLIDVSTFKQLCYRWNYQVMKKRPSKTQGHRAINDVVESIQEMKYY